MSDNIPPVTPAAATPVQPAASRGYFNKEQLEDTALAASVLTAANLQGQSAHGSVLDYLMKIVGKRPMKRL